MEESQETKKSEAHLSSAAAFVEGGIQEACDDACSICLEAFCDSDPSTVTSCKHEFHLQCILEWLWISSSRCQRSSQCPMCWQSISLKDPTSQELLDAVEKERSLRLNSPRHATIFHHPAFGDFELQHLPVGTSDAELEERIIQHLAAATAMGRVRYIARREGQRIRSSAHSHPRFLVFPTPNPHSVAAVSAQNGDGELTAAVGGATLSPPPTSVGEESSSLEPAAIHPVRADEVFASGSESTVVAANQEGTSVNLSSPRHTSPNGQDKAGPSELQSFSESVKSRFNALSMKYKESISKGTRGWKEKWFSRNTSMEEIGSEVRRGVNTGIATVSRMMERLETRDNDRTTLITVMDDGSIRGSNNQQRSVAANGSSPSDDNVPASCPAVSRQT